MKVNVVVGGVAFSLLLAAGPAHAQVLEAGVVIRSGPVTGHVVVARPAVYREPPRHVVVVDRYAPRVVIVERLYVPQGRGYGWWRGHGYRPVVVYYDATTGDGIPVRRCAGSRCTSAAVDSITGTTDLHHAPSRRAISQIGLVVS
jgi:hypothetical protein